MLFLAMKRFLGIPERAGLFDWFCVSQERSKHEFVMAYSFEKKVRESLDFCIPLFDDYAMGLVCVIT